jgi:predicted ATP-grasp superfamily ATP-dependent carboligase
MTGRPTTVFLEPYNGGLAAARALVRRGERVHVLAGAGDAFVARTRGALGRLVEQDQWIAALERVAVDGPAIVLTGTDVVSAFLAEHREQLPAGISAFEQQDDAHLALMRKDDADRIARRAGVRVPWTRHITTPAELDVAAREAPYPAVLKPVLSHRWRERFGDRRVLLVRNPEEARRVGEGALAEGLPLLLCEYVPGGDTCVEEAILVRTADGSYPVHLGCRKIRQFPVGFGAASLCEAAELPETMEMARAILDAVNFVGVCGVETKRHAETGERYFLDANVRLPTHWGLGDAAGLDSSARLAAVSRGARLGPQAPLRRSVRLVFPQLDVRAAMAAVRAEPPRGRPAEVLRIAASYRGVRDLGLLDPRDPAPLVSELRRTVLRRVSRRPR